MALEIVMTPASDGGTYARLELAAGENHWCCTRYAAGGDEMGMVDDLARAMVAYCEAGALGAVSVLSSGWVL